jgi:hypothetical protein
MSMDVAFGSYLKSRVNAMRQISCRFQPLRVNVAHAYSSNWATGGNID